MTKKSTKAYYTRQDLINFLNQCQIRYEVKDNFIETTSDMKIEFYFVTDELHMIATDSMWTYTNSMEIFFSKKNENNIQINLSLFQEGRFVACLIIPIESQECPKG